MASPEQVESRLQTPLPETKASQEIVLTAQNANGEIDPVAQRYTGLVGQYPQLGIHLSAIEQLKSHRKTRDAELTDEDREALLIYSLWSEDPITAIEIAENAGVTERTVNEYVGAVFEDPKGYGNTLLDIVDDLRHKAEAAQAQATASVAPVVEPLQIAPSTPIKPPSAPVIDRSMLYSNAEKAPIHGTLAQSYDHPILNGVQERILFGDLKNGVPIEEVRQNTNFINSFAIEDRPKITRILDQSATVEEAISSCYLRLVDVIARSHREIPLRDAINSGNIGLIQAARKWEPGEKGRFSTYAVWAIRSAVQQEQYQNRSSIRIPAYVQQDMAKAKWVTDAFQSLFGRTPTNEELRKQLLANTDMPGWRVNTLIRVMESRIQHVGSINTPISPDGDGEDEIGDFIADSTIDIEGSAVQKIADEELRKETRRALKEHLSSEEQQVIRALYGLDDVGEKTSEEVAREMGATPEVIIDIERRSLGKLRHDKWLREHWAEEPPSFIYGRSAESAAFRLGLFDDYEIPKIVEPTLIDHPLATAIRPREIAPVTVSDNGEILQATSEVGQPDGKVADNVIILKGVGQDYHLDSKFLQDEKVNPNNLSFDDLTTPRKIAVLRNAGLNNKQIAEILELKPSTVGAQASELLKQGLIQPLPWGRGLEKIDTAAVTSHQREILELLERGYSESEIGKKFGVTRAAISRHVRKLVKLGILEERKGTMDKSYWETITSKIKELRMAGLSYSEIGKEAGLSKETVSKYVRKLIEEGQLEPPKIASKEEDRRAAVSEETELVGKYLDAHPRPSYKDGFRRIFEARERKSKGGRPEIVEFDNQVKQLLDQGLTRKKMAEQLGVPMTTIDSSVHRMIKLGEYTPGKVTYNENQERIQTLIEQGQNVIQIAEALDRPLSYVQLIVWRLGRRGQISPTPKQLRPANRTGYVDKKASIPTGSLSDVYGKVAEMRQQGLSNSEIAKKLDLPVHKVEVYASNLIRAGVIQSQLANDRSHQVGVIDPNFEVPKGKYYDKVAQLRNQGLNNIQIAEQLSISVQRVHDMATKLIKAGIIQPLKPTAEEMKELRTQIKKLRAQGIGNQEIAQRLQKPINRIHNLASALINAGEIEPFKKKGRRPSEKRENLRSKIAELRNQRVGNTEIARLLSQPLSKVEDIAHELITAGTVKSQRPGKKSTETRDNPSETYEQRKIYRDAFTKLAEGHTIEVTPYEGETLSQIRHHARLTAKEIGKEAIIRETTKGTLLVSLKA